MSDPTRTSQSTRHATDPAAAAARTPAAAVAPTIRRPLAAAFRAGLTVAALTGLVLAALGDPAPAHLLTRFTVQANLAVALVSAGSAHRAWTGRRPVSPRLTGALLCFLALPALVHYALPAADATAFTLPATGTPTAAQALSHLLLHGLTPLAALADWLLLTAPAASACPAPGSGRPTRSSTSRSPSPSPPRPAPRRPPSPQRSPSPRRSACSP